MQFCGQDKCLIDANGRVKLSPRFLSDFLQSGVNIVMHCQPEGALGVYPERIWAQMRQSEARPALKAAQSVVFRRQLRRFGAMTQTESISKQGRITIPSPFRSLLELEPSQEIVLVGCEIGMEVWNSERWQREFKLLTEHERQKAEAEMAADLATLPPENY